MRLALLAVLLCAPSLYGQTITVQPTNQSVVVGQPATFLANVTMGPCRSLWFINGQARYGNIGSSFTYTIPSPTLDQSGTTVQLFIYGCSGGPGSVYSEKAVLTVVTGGPNISLAVTGSLLFDDGSTVYIGNFVISQWNGTSWVALGNVVSDANGQLSGTLVVNPNLADPDGNVEMQFVIPGPTAPLASVANTIPLLTFQQGSTGLTVTEVLFKAPFLTKMLAVSKSAAFALTP